MPSDRARHRTDALVYVFGLLVVAVLVWQGLTSHGAPNPVSSHLTRPAAMVDTGVLVFREGLEAILVLAAITASLFRKSESYGRPVASGAAAGLVATIATWFVVVWIMSSIALPELDIQAATGLLAILVLLVVMNWFFHRIYWTGWISLHTQKKNQIVNEGSQTSKVFFGLALLGFSSVYREGFEVVLFLQTIRLQVGGETVLFGASIGAVLTAMVAYLTFKVHHWLPYRKMLVLTGVMLGGVFLVMVGESVQEMQLAGWIPVSPLFHWVWPAWMSVWFAVFPTVESLGAQMLAALAVVGSYLVAEYTRVWRPRRLAARLTNSTSTG